MSDEQTFGYVDCAEHGDHQRAWFVCAHIKKLEDVEQRFPWTEEEGGGLCCKISPQDHKGEEIILMCEGHLKAYGLFEHIN